MTCVLSGAAPSLAVALERRRMPLLAIYDLESARNTSACQKDQYQSADLQSQRFLSESKWSPGCPKHKYRYGSRTFAHTAAAPTASVTFVRQTLSH